MLIGSTLPMLYDCLAYLTSINCRRGCSFVLIGVLEKVDLTFLFDQNAMTQIYCKTGCDTVGRVVAFDVTDPWLQILWSSV